MVVKGLQILKKNSEFMFNREDWMAEAELAEKSQNLLTCEAIIKAVIFEGVEEDDRARVWMDECEHYAEKGSLGTSRAIYNHAIEVLADTKPIFLKALDVE
jgi:pre-mRNA-processing factor 6